MSTTGEYERSRDVAQVYPVQPLHLNLFVELRVGPRPLAHGGGVESAGAGRYAEQTGERARRPSSEAGPHIGAPTTIRAPTQPGRVNEKKGWQKLAPLYHAMQHTPP